jgi:hypothetical protein
LAGIVALGASAAPGLADSGEPDERLRIEGLRVFGGERTWHSMRAFRVDWDLPDPDSQALIDGVGYRIEDADGEVVVPAVHVGDDGNALEGIKVPPSPGAYTLAIWLEGPAGAGPPAEATLRFDDVAPAPVRPLPPQGWVKAGAEALVRIEHPAAPWPIAGIRGYAIALERGSGAMPCERAGSCTEAETDLRGGAGDDWIALRPLAEGVNVVRVLAVSGAGVSSAEVGSAELRVDGSAPAVRFGPLPQGWSDAPVQVRALASDELSGMDPAPGSNALTALSVDGDPPQLAAGDAALVTVRGDGVHVLSASARDAAGNATWDGAGTASPTALVRIDESPPRVAFAQSQDPMQPERIEASVADSLSGPGERGWIEVRPAGTRLPYLPLPTRMLAGRLVAVWDSDSYPAGKYEFRAVGFDAAGNRAVGESRESGSKMELASPLKTQTRVQLGFGGASLTVQRCVRHAGRVRCRRRRIASLDRRPAAARIGFGRGMRLSGRLSSAAGAPLGGLPLSVIEDIDPGGEASERTTTVRTRADGTFSTRLAPGPSRRVRVAFAGGALLSASASRTLRLGVRSAVRLHVSAPTARVGGAPVLFSGSVAPADPAGSTATHSVELQYRLSSGPWGEFGSVETDARGRFRYPYAFSDDDSRGVRFQFRALVPRQPGWPYAAGASLPVFVSGR